jgi:hypothetical protein
MIKGLGRSSLNASYNGLFIFITNNRNWMANNLLVKWN